MSLHSKTGIPLAGIGVSNVGFEDTDAPLKLGQVDHSPKNAAKRQEAEGEAKHDIESELKDSAEDTEIEQQEYSHL